MREVCVEAPDRADERRRPAVAPERLGEDDSDPVFTSDAPARLRDLA